MGDCDYSCERKLMSSHSTFGLPPVKSDSSLVDDKTGVERISKAFSPPENRLAPLLGKKLFMHYESGTARDKQMEQEVVEFFSRDVDYVITNRISSRLTSSVIDESHVTSSKQSISLQNQSSSISQAPNNLKVPVLIGSKPVNSPVTRGRAMLLAARKIAAEDSNSTPSGITASSILNQAQTSNDVSVAPVQSQSSSMSCVLGCGQKLNSNNDLLYKARQLGIKILSFDTSSTTAAINDEPSGYCECCSANFKSLFEHLHCTDHQQFANNSENYRLLDDVLNKLPTLKEFLTKTTSTTSQLPSYLNPIAISPCDSQHEKDYLLNTSKCVMLQKENIPPTQTKINESIEPVFVSQKSQPTLNDYKNISKEINVPPTLNFSGPLGPNEFTEGGSDIFSNTDLDVCEISKTTTVVHNDVEQISKLDQEEAAFLFLL
ncbi:hypothetical protein Smp_078700 [Schistosoma mansoni]|uniref:hypothetical protein n=1 Tax=Schistosoma mansoni TaxID=6183 RepID=UPI00019B3670|nr:hypothetical protein Smp_078700 [Schistosoma mansoni]|eukprot:XP_018652302.1 hypothetical protein Smp_078700 [Schistosoma mansoni]